MLNIDNMNYYVINILMSYFMMCSYDKPYIYVMFFNTVSKCA